MPAILSNQKVRRSEGSAALSTTGAVTPTAWYSWATVAGKFALYTGLIVSILPLGTATGGPVKLRSEEAFKLESLGLLVPEGNRERPRCRLYAQYMVDRLTA